MNIRTDAQINKEILRTLAHYQRLATSMATPVCVVLLPVAPLVVMSYEELSRPSQGADNSDCVDIAAMISRHAVFESTISSLVDAHKRDIAALHSRMNGGVKQHSSHHYQQTFGEQSVTRPPEMQGQQSHGKSAL
jgi:hypothetical protein